MNAALLKAIDDLIALIAENQPISRIGGERWEQFDKLDREVWVHACLLGLESKLPQKTDDSDFMGKTNLPGIRMWTDFQPVGWSGWIKDMRALRTLAEANSGRQLAKRNRPGKPSKDETPADVKIIGALNVLLNRDNRIPPTGREIARESGVANVSRFIRKHWGSHTQFASAWRRGDMNVKLAKIQGYLSEQHEEYDDQRTATGGRRRAGRTPGSNRDDE